MLTQPQNQKQHGQKFSRRESQCLVEAIQDKNLTQIAESLKISERSVYFYLQSIRKKVDMLTKQVTHQ